MYSKNNETPWSSIRIHILESFIVWFETFGKLFCAALFKRPTLLSLASRQLEPLNAVLPLLKWMLYITFSANFWKCSEPGKKSRIFFVFISTFVKSSTKNWIKPNRFSKHCQRHNGPRILSPKLELGTPPPQKKTGKCGNFSQVGDPPLPPVWEPHVCEKK